MSPTPYKTVTEAGETELDNGMYDLLIEHGDGSKVWAQTGGRDGVFVVDGVYDVQPITEDTTVVRARFYGPYDLEPDTEDDVGAALIAGAVYNSRGVQAWGHAHATGSRIAASRTGGSIIPTHQGWTTDGEYYYTFHTTRFTKRRRDAEWTEVSTNSTPFAGLIDAEALDHLGDGAYHNGRLYVPVEYYDNGAASAAYQQIAVYDAGTLALIATHDISADLGAADAGSVAILADRNEVAVTRYAASHTDSQIFIFDLTTFAYKRTISITAAIRYLQGVAYANGLLYCTGQREGGTAAMAFAFNLDGSLAHELIITDASSTIEGCGFDTDGSFGILYSNDTTVSEVKFYDLPTIDNHTVGGFLAAKDRFIHIDGLTPPTDTTIVLGFVPTTLYDFNQLWDQTVSLTTYNGWIYANGRVAGRMSASSATSASGVAVAGTAGFYAFSENRSTRARALYYNNADRVTTDDPTDPVPAWPTGAAFCLLGGHASHQLADVHLRFSYIFDRTLTLGEKQALEADPGRIWLATNALSDAEKARIAA